MRVFILCSMIILIFSCTHTGVDCQEKPAQGCTCTKEYKPVCGCNNITYDNKCTAECAGIYGYKEGACK